MCTEFEEFECEVHKENTQLQSVEDDFAIDTHNVQSSEESVEHFSVDNEAVQKVNFILFVLHKFHTLACSTSKKTNAENNY